MTECARQADPAAEAVCGAPAAAADEPGGEQVTSLALHGPAAPRLRPGWRHTPAPSRLAPDHPDRDGILEAHALALRRGDTTYCDPATGLHVLTAAALAARGTCCTSGCRHCPYVEAGSAAGAAAG
jgi:hypothetical protein